MVCKTSRKILLPSSESTITNDGRISPTPTPVVLLPPTITTTTTPTTTTILPTSPDTPTTMNPDRPVVPSTEEEQQEEQPQSVSADDASSNDLDQTRNEDDTNGVTSSTTANTTTTTIRPRTISTGTAISILTTTTTTTATPPIVVGRQKLNTRDVSNNTNNSISQNTEGEEEEGDDQKTYCSRESLRKAVLTRKQSLTIQEHSYLDHLIVHGNDLEVVRALKTFQDEDLFFEYSTPRHYLGQPLGDDMNDDETEQPVEDTTTTTTISYDSRRLQVLEARKKNSIQHITLWRAHKTGLALSGLASRASIVRRASSSGAVLGSGASISSQTTTNSAIPRVPPNERDIFRFGSNTTIHRNRLMSSVKRNEFSLPPLLHGRSTTTPGLPLPPPHSFRRSQSMLKPPPPDIPQPKSIQRFSSSTSRKSVTFTSETDGTPKPKQSKASDTNAFDKWKSKTTTTTTTIQDEKKDDEWTVKEQTRLSPTTPDQQLPQGGHQQEFFFLDDDNYSIPSLHHAHPIGRQDSTASSIASLHHAQPIRQESTASIASLHHAHPIRQESTASITSLHHAHPIRQESTASITSLHHAHPIRQESTASIPSLHHAHPIRQESTASIPGLHHAHHIRNDSTASIPSLHHAHPVRQDSMGASSIPSPYHAHFSRRDSTGSIPSPYHAHRMRNDSMGVSSIPSLHHAHPVRQDSMGASSVPSLHHAHPVRQDSMGASSVPSLHHGTALLDDASSSTRGLKYEPSNDIVNAWMQQQQVLPQPSFGSVPHDVTFPSVTTEDTFPETVDTEPTFPITECTSSSQLLLPTHRNKAIFMRLASRNADEGEGVEVTELDDEPVINTADEDVSYPGAGRVGRWIPSMIPVDVSIRTCNSWDTGISSYYYQHPQQPNPPPNYDEIFRNGISRSLSHDDYQILANIYLGASATVFDSSQALNLDETSWDTTSEIDEPRMDSWNILKDDYVNGYGGGDSLDFMILGTDADDEAAQPHVLSPPLMESLQAFLPYSKTGQNFYLKYSMVRDGASLLTFLRRSRGVQYSILALETVNGEVFGAFTGMPWRKNWNNFGSGESFLWKMRRSRMEKTHDILEQAHLESEIDVYPFTGENRYIQLCTHDRIAVGGGTPAEKKEEDEVVKREGSTRNLLDLVKPHEWGFGLAISADLLTGTSSPCVTFGSPSLCASHSDGSVFEIVNLELWTLTPCRTEAEAEKLELGKLFLSSGDSQ